MIAVEHAELSYGGVPVLRDCCLSLDRGELASLSGPSGSGKTSLLRLIAGLTPPDRGSVRTGGTVSFAFQEPRLFPWLTAEENLALVLEDRREALPWLARAGLGDAAKKYPPELSGGMRQRLNLLRALAWGGEILLLDEPFRGLDPALRESAAALIRDNAAEHRQTVLLVSHDPAEPALLGVTRRYVLRDGRAEPED